MAEANASKTPLLDSLDSMSAQELTALIDAAEGKRREKLETAKQELVAEFRAKASELGLSLEALFSQQQAESASASASVPGRKPRSDAGTTRPAKYRGPNGEEWSGRGRTPNWLTGLEAEGRSREEFVIAPELGLDPV